MWRSARWCLFVVLCSCATPSKPALKAPLMPELPINHPEQIFEQEELTQVSSLGFAQYSALLSFELYKPTSQQEWDKQAMRRLWDPQGQAYLELTFLHAQHGSRVFELSERTPPSYWETSLPYGLRVQHSGSAFKLYWTEKLKRGAFLAQYSEVHIKAWNTSAGVVIDQFYQVDWGALRRLDVYSWTSSRRLRLCRAPRSGAPLLACMSSYLDVSK